VERVSSESRDGRTAAFLGQVQALSQGGHNVDLGRVVRALWRRKGLILLVTIAFAVVGFGFAKLVTPRYTAEAELVLLVRNPPGESLATMQGGIYTQDTAEVASIIDILTSPETIWRTVREYHLENDPEFNTLLAPPGPTAEIWSRLRRIWAAAPSGPPPEGEGPAIAEANLRRRLSVTNDGRSYTIIVSFTSVDPIKAAKIANAIARTYLAEDLSARAAELDRLSGLLDHRSAVLRQRMIDTRAAVAAYKAQHGILDLGKDQTLLDDTIAKFNSEVVAAEAERVHAESALAQLQEFARNRNAEAAARAAGASENLTTLIDRRNKAAADLTEVETNHGPDNPWVIETRNTLIRIDNQVDHEVRQSMMALRARVGVEKTREQVVKARLARLVASNLENMKAGAELRRLEADADTARALYETFLETAGKASVESYALSGDARIVSPAVPPFFPSLPHLSVVLAISGLAGLASGLAVALGLEAARPTLCTPEEVSERLGVATLGLTPHIAGHVPRTHGAAALSLAVVNDPLGGVAESIRSIGIAVGGGVGMARVVLVTSALPGEGKTSFALSLGRLAATAGRRVLLVECDMRSAQLGTALGGRSGPGLGEVLRGTGELSEVINLDEASGMHFVSSGSGIDFPAERLNSSSMHQFVALARQRYELVILDTPAAGVVVDALQLASAVDIAVLIVEWARTSYKAVSIALERLQTAGAPLVGVVLSHVRLRKLKSYGSVYAATEANAYRAKGRSQ
jgi:polysaccharide biosynthesis transport protein